MASNGASPPAQGGIYVLGQDLVDAPGAVQPLFQFIDRVVEIRGCGCPDNYAQCELCSSGECGVNCGDKFQQFLIGCERPCDPAAKTILGARCSVRQWTHMFCVSKGGSWKKFWGFLREWAHSAPEVNSRPALLFSGVEVAMLVVDPGSGLFSIGFAGIYAPRAVLRRLPSRRMEKCAQYMLRPTIFPGNLDIISTNTLLCSIFSCAQSPLVIFLSPRRRRDLRCRGLGGGGVAGSLTPR